MVAQGKVTRAAGMSHTPLPHDSAKPRIVLYSLFIKLHEKKTKYLYSYEHFSADK